MVRDVDSRSQLRLGLQCEGQLDVGRIDSELGAKHPQWASSFKAFSQLLSHLVFDLTFDPL